MTMASGCSSGEILSAVEPAAGDLATAISQGTVSKEMLEQCAQKGLIDVPDKDGRTPLMIACLTGLEDVVQFLLANFAFRNAKGINDGNTALHYACMVKDAKEEETLYDRVCKLSKVPSKISVVKLLLNYGVSVKKNLDGWSPVCVAALYLQKDIVDFFLSQRDTPLEDKIKASEILGVLQASVDHHPLSDAFQSFCRALTLQEDAGAPIGQCDASELASCLSKISLKESHTLEEFKSAEPPKPALLAHALLVGERIFPPSLKQRYFIPLLIRIGGIIMFHEEMAEAGFQIFSHALSFERRGEIQPGGVLEKLSFAYMFHMVPYGFEEPQPPVRQRTRDLLDAYSSIFSNLPIDDLWNVCHTFMHMFGVILFKEAFDFTSHDDLKFSVEDIQKLLKVIRGRIRRERPEEYLCMPSVALEIMTLVRKEFQNEFLLSDFQLCFLRKVRYVLLRVLLFDSASYQDRSTGNTLLHVLADTALAARDKKLRKCTQDHAWAFVRHGCPLDAVNGEGQTAQDILEESGSQKPHIKLMQSLLSPPTTVLHLQEATARVVLRHKIDYKDILPRRLCEMVDGVTDLDLKRSVFKRKDRCDSSGSSEENNDSSLSSDSSTEDSESSDESNDSDDSTGSNDDNE